MAYLPVHVSGGLISMGDGHALQGDVEVTITALETSLRGTVQIFVRQGKQILWPRGETPSLNIAMGLHPDLNEAARIASEMIDFWFPRKECRATKSICCARSPLIFALSSL